MGAEKVNVGEALVTMGLDITEYLQGFKTAKGEMKDFLSQSKTSADVFKGIMASEMVKAVVEFVKKSMEEYVKLDRAIERTTQTLKKLGMGYKEGREFVEKYTDSVEALTEFTDEAAAVSLNTLLLKTQDLTASLKLNSLAMDIASRTGQDLNDVAGDLGLAFQGNDRALMMLARQLGITGEHAQDAGYIFKELETRFSGAATESGKLYPELQKLTAEFGNLGESMATSLKPASIAFVQGATDMLRVVQGKGAFVQAQRDVETYSEKLDKLKGFLDKVKKGQLEFMDSQRLKAGIITPAKIEDDIKKYERLLKAAQAAFKAQGGEIPGSGKGGPDLAAIAKANQLKAKEEERLQKANAERGRLAGEEIDSRNKMVDMLVAQDQAGQALAATMTGPVSQSMQQFFTEVIDGTKSLINVFEALGKAIIKSMLGALATVLEQQAAADLATAMGWSASIIGAGAAPGFFAKAGLEATAAGGIRAVAASLAQGGVVQPSEGGTVVQVAEGGKAELVSPIDTLMNTIHDAVASGSGGAVSIQNVHLNMPNVTDASSFQRPNATRSAVLNLARQIQELKSRTRGRNSNL